MKADSTPKGPTAFSKPASRRIAHAVRQVEADWGRPPDQRRGRAMPWNPGVLRALVTVAIPTGISAAPSTSGQVAIQRWTRSARPRPTTPN